MIKIMQDIKQQFVGFLFYRNSIQYLDYLETEDDNDNKYLIGHSRHFFCLKKVYCSNQSVSRSVGLCCCFVGDYIYDDVAIGKRFAK